MDLPKGLLALRGSFPRVEINPAAGAGDHEEIQLEKDANARRGDNENE